MSNQSTLSGGGRRGLLRSAGMAGAMAGVAVLSRGITPAQAATIGDPDILNFALNLEYLEAEYYLRATTGVGLTAADTSGTGNQGTVVGGGAVPFKSKKLAQLAAEIASNEKSHVEFLRSAWVHPPSPNQPLICTTASMLWLWQPDWATRSTRLPTKSVSCWVPISSKMWA